MSKKPTKKHNIGKPLIRGLTQLRDGLKAGTIKVKPPAKPADEREVEALAKVLCDAAKTHLNTHIRIGWLDESEWAKNFYRIQARAALAFCRKGER